VNILAIDQGTSATKAILVGPGQQVLGTGEAPVRVRAEGDCVEVDPEELLESVLAAGDMAFLDRLWQDWCPGYDASEDLRNVKQCLRGEGNLAAAIGYYRAGEPGLHHFGADGAYAAEEAALASAGPQPTLYLHGNRDGCIDLALVEDAECHLTAGSRMQVVEGAGHFLHVEKPAAVNDQILAWVST